MTIPLQGWRKCKRVAWPNNSCNRKLKRPPNISSSDARFPFLSLSSLSLPFLHSIFLHFIYSSFFLSINQLIVYCVIASPIVDLFSPVACGASLTCRSFLATPHTTPPPFFASYQLLYLIFTPILILSI